MEKTTSLGIFWACPVCGFRYVEAPVAGQRGQICPRCGASARVVAQVPALSEEASPLPAPPPPALSLAVLLDNIRSAYNVGAAFRAADGAGVSKLYLGGITPKPTHRQVAKTALGAERHVPWEAVPNGPRMAAALQAAGWTVWALEATPRAQWLTAALPTPRPQRLLLVVGNEVAGVDPALLDLADAVVALPMWGYKRSLNVATALTAALYVLRLSDNHGKA